MRVHNVYPIEIGALFLEINMLTTMVLKVLVLLISLTGLGKT